MRSDRLLSMASAVIALTITVAPRLANACAVCGLGPNDVGGHAFNNSVLFMMAVPYATFALIGGFVYFAWRKSHRRHDSAFPVPLKGRGETL